MERARLLDWQYRGEYIRTRSVRRVGDTDIEPAWADEAFADDGADLAVVRGGVEPPTFRFSGASAASLHVAGRGLMGHLAAQTMAGCRLMSPDICRR